MEKNIVYQVCRIGDVKEGRGNKFIVDGDEIVLVKIDGEVCAFSNMCPHQKFQKLHDGMFENGIITCPMHGWAFDVRSGNSATGSGKLKMFRTSVTDGRVSIIDTSDENTGL